MSKRDNNGDVIANQLSLVEAKGQRLLASLFGSHPESTARSNGADSKDEDEDLKQNFGHDRLGVGGILPKDIEDGSFTRRIPTSNDKLLEQLIGKKKAKAHLATRQDTKRPNAKAQYGKRNIVKKEESEDEEEGRAATFSSKRKKAKVFTSAATKEDSDDEDEESRTKRLAAGGDYRNANAAAAASTATEVKDEDAEAHKQAGSTRSSKNVSGRGKMKSTSFLDEILAERSIKKKKKEKGQG